jgi:SAM-dependent methyltransferase
VHPSAHARMAECIERYLPKDRPYRVVDLGSRRVRRQPLTHRELLRHHDHSYLGVDIRPGPNVGAVMQKPYRIPVASGSVDVVLSGQTFEHIPFPWASMLEIARILKPGGYLFLTAPSRGHVHGPVDCWRYYPDGLRALGAFSGLEVVEARTEFPPRVEEGRRHHYAGINTDLAYWGDSVGVFRKPSHYPSWRIAPIRGVVIWWANQQCDLNGSRRRRRQSARRQLAKALARERRRGLAHRFTRSQH